MTEESREYGQWSEKHRPHTLKTYVGQTAAKRLAARFVKDRDDLPHTLLISGPSGNGKTTLARIIACQLMGKVYRDINEAPDVMERDIGDSGNKADIQNVLDMVKFRPRGKYKIIILDEAHGLSTKASNMLLKALEEPPKYLVWILCTDKPEKLPATILNRCFKIDLGMPSEADMRQLITRVAKQEKIFPPEKCPKLVKRIIVESNSIPREALQLMQSIKLQTESGAASTKDAYLKAVQALHQNDDGATAVDILAGVYSKDASAVIAAASELNSGGSALFWLLNLNRTLLYVLSGKHTYRREMDRRLIAQLKKVDADASLEFTLKVHSELCQIKRDTNDFQLDPKDLFISRLATLAIR